LKFFEKTFSNNLKNYKHKNQNNIMSILKKKIKLFAGEAKESEEKIRVKAEDFSSQSQQSIFLRLMFS